MVPTVNSPLAKHHPIGASTGYLTDLRGNWNELLEAVERTSTFATELAALSEPELRGLRDFLVHADPLPFRYLSVHAPVKHLQAHEEEMISWLLALPPEVRAIVTHPDTMDDPTSYRPLGNRLVVENMDSRKATGRTPEELAPIFAELPDAGFCFDIAHAWSIDPTMVMAGELLDRFGDRLRHVHLSSLQDGRHVPVLPEHDILFQPLLDRCRDVPWILEAERPARWMQRAA
jgi:xylose isomerase-like TIM barrel protein